MALGIISSSSLHSSSMTNAVAVNSDMSDNVCSVEHPQFGVGLAELLAGRSESETIPRIMIFLGDYLVHYVTAAIRNLQHPKPLSLDVANNANINVMNDIRLLLQEQPSMDTYSHFYEAFSHGRFRDPGSMSIAFKLLKSFIRELSVPLFPSSLYTEALDITHSHLKSSLARLQASPYYIQFLSQLPDAVVAELSPLVADLWKVSIHGAIAVDSANAGVHEALRPLQQVVNQLAYVVPGRYSDLEELFFRLPRIHRNALEYLGVLCSRLDVIVARSIETKAGMSVESCMGAWENALMPSTILQDLAAAFSPFVMRPSVWTAASVQEKQQSRASQRNFLTFFFSFIKHKHRLLSSVEMAALDIDPAELVNRLLLAALPATHRMQLALSNSVSSSKGGCSSSDGSSISSPYSCRKNCNESHGEIFDAAATSLNISSRLMSRKSRMHHVASPLKRGNNRSYRGSDEYVEIWVDTIAVAPTILPVPSCLFNTRSSTISTFYVDDSTEKFTHLCDTENDSRNLLNVNSPKAFQRNSMLPDISNINATVKSVRLVQLGWDTPNYTETLPLDQAPFLRRWLDESLTMSATSLTNPNNADLSFSPFDISSGGDLVSNCDQPDNFVEHKLSLAPGEGLVPVIPSSPFEKTSFSTLNVEDTEERPVPFERPIGTNYDQAFSFPRTFDTNSVFDRVDDGNIVRRFLFFSSFMKKAPFLYDTEPALLNHKVPELPMPGETCEACCRVVTGFTLISKYRVHLCHYCGRRLCGRCCDRCFVIPSCIVTKGDLHPHSVCQPCEEHLNTYTYTPLIELKRLLPTAISTLGTERISAIKLACARLQRCIFYHLLPSCPSRQLMLSLIPPRIIPLLTIFPESTGPRVSLADVCEIRTRHYLRRFDVLERLFRSHVTSCPHCLKVRRICSAMDDCNMGGDKVLNPKADLHDIILCRRCACYCHRACWDETDSQCLLCTRKPEENVRSLLQIKTKKNMVSSTKKNNREKDAFSARQTSAPETLQHYHRTEDNGGGSSDDDGFDGKQILGLRRRTISSIPLFDCSRPEKKRLRIY